MKNRRGIVIFFLVFGSCLIGLAIALQVGWIFFSLERIALLVIGIIFFAAIITGLVLNMIFLVREIRRNEQHDAFINSVTHELKTPIASIRLYLETLKTREVTEAKRNEFYDVMLSDSERLLNTVEQVLQAGRTRDRKRLLNISEINLVDLIDECIERIKIRYKLDKEIIILQNNSASPKLKGDASELQTVFLNLIDNAIKYSGKDSQIFIEINDAEKEKLEIHLKDSGIGIPQNDLKRVFRRFYRVPGIGTQKAKGTGLGLFIVKSIIDRHHGTILAESDGEGLGTTFIVQLPKNI